MLYYQNVTNPLSRKLHVPSDPTPFLLFLFCFVFYSVLRARTVFGGDSGDLLSAIAVNGVAHPSGYPLFTVVGIVLKSLPLHIELAAKVGLGSAFFGSLTIVFVYIIGRLLWKKRLLSLIAALTLAFVFPFWLYSEITDVIALHNLFVAMLLYFPLRYYIEKKIGLLYISSFLAGLSLTNNESVLLLFPVITILVFMPLIRRKDLLRPILISVSLFALGLLPYIYIPIAASGNPPVSWNNAVTVPNFLNLVLRKDYGWVSPTKIGTTVRGVAFLEYISYLRSELPIIAILSALVGVLTAWSLKKKRLIAFSLTSGAILFGVFFFTYAAGPNYDIFSNGSREKFVASGMLFLVLFLSYGIIGLWTIAERLLKSTGASKNRLVLYEKAFTCFFFLIPILLLMKNIAALDLRGVLIPRELGYDLLVSLPDKSVLIGESDNIVFPTWYNQHALHQKATVYVVTPKELISSFKRGMFRTKQLPSELQSEKLSELDRVAFSLGVPVFSAERNYHQSGLGDLILVYPYGLVWRYATTRDEQIMTEDVFLRRQNKLLQSLSSPKESLPLVGRERLLLLNNMPLFYAHAYANTGFFLMYAYNDLEKARLYFLKALEIDDEDGEAYEGLGIVYYKLHEYTRARDALSEAVALFPLNRNAYYLLYATVLKAHDITEQKRLESYFAKYHALYPDFNFDKTKLTMP